MTVRRVRPGSLPYPFLLLLLSAFLGSCKQPPAPEPTPPAAPDPKGELIASLEGAEVEGYLFSLDEAEGRTTASLTNPAVHDLVRLGEGDPGLVLRYARVEARDQGASGLYRSEVLRRQASLAVRLTDLVTDQVVDEWPFPPAGPDCEPKFESLFACIDEFECKEKGRFQCEANRTCQPQLVSLTCCLEAGRIIVHLIVPPTDRRCQLRGVIPDLVLSQD